MSLTETMRAEAEAQRAWLNQNAMPGVGGVGVERCDWIVTDLPEPARHFEATCTCCFLIKPVALIASGRCADCR